MPRRCKTPRSTTRSAPRRAAAPLGGSGRRWWFVDGQPIAETAAGAEFSHPFARPGQYQLSVLDESGQTAQVKFNVNE
ncbi:hypothetical protein HP532_23225 [Pseudomonas sp. CrR25]|nr:hypothetical protein [Pseudomonas sp. CrR25]